MTQVAKEFIESLTSVKGKDDKLRIISLNRENLPELVFPNQKRPEWATKEWVDNKRASLISSGN